MGKPREITVAIVDDHNMIRAGLRGMLERHPDLRVIGEGGSTASAIRLAQTRRPDVLLLDLHLPGAEPQRDIERLRSEAPSMKTVFLTMDTDPRKAGLLLRAGASGYVLKQSDEHNVAAAIRQVASGQRYVDPALEDALEKLNADPLAGLSERDLTLLRLLALGHTNREVGEHLFLSVRTIEVSRSRLMNKLGLSSRAELVRYALNTGLIEPSD